MTKPHVRFGTITGTLTNYLPVTGIEGDGSNFQAYFLQVKLATLDVEQAEWEWPKFRYTYLSLDDFLTQMPALGDQVSLDGELSLTNFAVNGHGLATASAIKALYQRMVLYADNWAEVNLVDGPRREFDALTRQYADSQWQFDEWLNNQVALLPHHQALAQLQALLVTVAKQRSELYNHEAPVAALMQTPTRNEVTHSNLFDSMSLGYWASDAHVVRIDDERDKQALHQGLLKQSAERLRREM